MARFTMEDLERLAGEGGRTETYQDPDRINTSQAPSPAPARRDVRSEVWNTCYAAGQALTLRQICDRLNVKKAPWMKQHVDNLVREGYLRRIQSEYITGAKMYLYEAVT